MPRLSPHGNVGMGIAGIQGSINQVLIPDSLGQYFLDDGNTIFQQPSTGTLVTLDLVTGQRVEVATTGANDLAAGGKAWAAWLDDRGLFSSRGLQRLHAGLLDVGPDGSIGYIGDRQVGRPALVFDKSGTDWLLIDDFVFDLQLLGDRKAIWRDQFNQIHTNDLPFCKQVGRANRPRAVQLNGEWWVCYWSDTMGVVLHPFDETTGYIVVPLGFNAFNQDIMITDSFTFRVVWSSTQGERPQDFRESFISSLSPRTPLIPNITVPVIGRDCWVGWFEFGVIPDGTLLAPGNSSLMVITGGNIIDANGTKFAQWIQRNPNEPDDVSVIEEKAKATFEPCVAFWDARHWPRWPDIKPWDWLCINGYCGVNETPEQLLAAISAIIESVPERYKRICLVCQCYTYNTTQTTNLIGIVPVYAELARVYPRITMLLVFSDLGRATGLNDHPEVRPYWEALMDGVTGTPAENEEDLLPMHIFETLVRLRPKYPTPMNGRAAELVNEAAFIHREEGWGLQQKDGGNRCSVPDIEPTLACDIMRLRNWGYDCLIDAEGEATPTRGAKGPADLNTFIEPVGDSNDIGIIIFSATSPTRRSDPLGCHITFDAGGSLPIIAITVELLNSGMEPKVMEFPVFPGNDGRFFRGINVKLTHEGTFQVRVTAEDDAGNTASALGPFVTVIP